MIDGRQCGPFELSQLADAGVRPDTYVWCKDMSDWEKARDVAEICRFFRCRLAGVNMPDLNNSQPTDQPNGLKHDSDNIPFRFRRIIADSDITPAPAHDTQPDTSQPPKTLLPLAILFTLLCFPLTGFVAIYYSVMASRLWAEGQKDRTDAKEYREMAHDYARQAKMWTGITFFLGLILIAFVVRFYT